MCRNALAAGLRLAPTSDRRAGTPRVDAPRDHLPRAEDRTLALFSDLGERFGRVTPDGILIDLPLNRELIGRLTASGRPTATLALLDLDHQGLLTRLAHNSWKLAFSGPSR